MARRTGIAVVFAALLALVLAVGAPAALAHHKDDHTQGGRPDNAGSQGAQRQDQDEGGDDAESSDHDGDADSDSGTTYTEDNDTNDGDTPNNQSDKGDNAHPSRKDRSVEAGGSGNQGNSESDPDDDGRGPDRTNGGPDKPNGSGGVDAADQDGNNGCGNDDDFEDDNEGLCGGNRVKANKPCDADATMPGVQKCEEVEGDIITDTPKPCDADATMPGAQVCNKPVDEVDEADEVEVLPEVDEESATPVVDAVLGVRINRSAQPAAVAPAAVAPAAVAPAAVSAAAETQGGVLPFTGTVDLIPLIAVALLLIAAGALGVRARNNA